jgi:hypothetical protein
VFTARYELNLYKQFRLVSSLKSYKRFISHTNRRTQAVCVAEHGDLEHILNLMGGRPRTLERITKQEAS